MQILKGLTREEMKAHGWTDEMLDGKDKIDAEESKHDHLRLINRQGKLIDVTQIEMDLRKALSEATSRAERAERRLEEANRRLEKFKMIESLAERAKFTPMVAGKLLSCIDFDKTDGPVGPEWPGGKLNE